MSLLTSKVPRSLETKSKLFGFELGDTLVIFLYLSASNLVFGGTSLKSLLVWGGTASLSAALYFGKRGKPEGHLRDLLTHLLSPAVFAAGLPDREYSPLRLTPEVNRRGTRKETHGKFW